jgi:hypothetical protein
MMVGTGLDMLRSEE